MYQSNRSASQESCQLLSLKRKRQPRGGKAITLFNGKDLAGWHSSNRSQPLHWTVEEGTLVSNGSGPEIITDSKFEDFKLHVEFNCGIESNSGVYLRGRYEVQIETDSAEESPSHYTGGVYGFLAPTPELPRKSGESQSFDISLLGRMITVVQSGHTVIDHQEIPGITGGGARQSGGIARAHLFARQRKGTRSVPEYCDYSCKVNRLSL